MAPALPMWIMTLLLEIASGDVKSGWRGGGAGVPKGR
jgi:hypothetical protein